MRPVLPLDVFDSICAFVSETEEKERAKTLIALAQTHKAGHAVATRYIWHTIPDIHPLLNLLPRGVWDPSAKKLLRAVQTLDLVKLKMHAAYVRCYGFVPGVRKAKKKTRKTKKKANIYQGLDKVLSSLINAMEDPLLLNVKIIEVVSQDFSVPTTLLKLLGVGQPLIKATFRCFDATPAKWKTLSNDFASRCSHTSLRSLTLHDGNDNEEQEADDALQWTREHLEPLLVFKNLTNLNIDICGPLRINDEFVEKMAQSWTEIWTLRLYADDFDGVREVNLEGIQSLGKHCPDLRSLTMYFNAREPIDAVDDYNGPPKLNPPSSCKLERLKVLYSPVEDPNMVAAFLKDSFPALKELAYPVMGEMPLFDDWAEVQELMGIDLPDSDHSDEDLDFDI